LSDVVFASGFDEHLVHVSFGTLIHSLIDFVDESEGCSCEFSEGEKVSDRSQGSFLSREDKYESVNAMRSRAKEPNSLLQIDDDHSKREE